MKKTIDYIQLENEFNLQKERNINLEDELRTLKHKFVQFDINEKLYKELFEIKKTKYIHQNKAGWFVWTLFIFAVVSLTLGLVDKQQGNPFFQCAIIFFAFAMLLGFALVREKMDD